MVPRYSGPVLSVLSGFSGIGIAAFVFDWPLSMLLPAAVAIVAVEAYRLAERRYELNRGWVKLPLAVALLLLAALGLTEGGALWAVALFSVGGAWLLADGVCDLRYGMVDERRPADSLRYMSQVGRVYRAVRADPRSADALAANLDISEERLEHILETLERRGRVEAEGGIYYPDSGSGVAWVDRPSRALGRAARRLARPARLVR